ncbi:hypothetical protein AUK40_00985 [Candidatus Wirthbacteria bacterium CG2_30_54_11]|uniref:SCP domain-containing protein n=1 Tax=Candidatus Wirthbacteria bacterium CG2_30_54_11 TaxID=1817892 RepID=A0A1J5IPA6_9BACT|nr:MAG: hypothetical protein AUK40_00985 [Candidatus Wirthbacteria bacterium CG2_30_54_11]
MITILHHLRHLRITIETTVVFILWMVLGQCSAALAAIDRGALLTLHNQARTAAGLSELSLSDPLTTAAQNKTNDMLADQYFAHTSPDGITPWNWIRGAGYVYDGAGENLAIDYFSTAAVFDAWMNSPGHRANILNGAFAEVGFGVAEGEFEGRQTTLITVTFGHRASASDPGETSPQTNNQSTYTPTRNTPPAAPPRDTTAPAAPSILIPASDSLLSTGTCEITGQAEAGCTVRIYNGENLVGETTADQDGNFAVSIETPDGAYELTATATDQSGNISETSAVAFNIDTAAPSVPAILTPATDAILSSATTRITGRAEAGSTVKVYDGDTLVGETTADQTGQFATDIEYPDGSYQLTATATDQAGNRSERTTAVAFTIDTLAPQINAAAPVQVSRDVMADRSFLARVQVAEPVTGLQATAHIGDEDFIMQPNEAEQSFDLTTTATATTTEGNRPVDETAAAPAQTDEMTIAFTLSDTAGNSIDIPATTITVLERYAVTTRQLPIEQIFWETVTDPSNQPVQLSAYAAALLGLVEVGFAVSRVKPLPALTKRYHAVAQYAMAGITAILFIKH